MMRTTRIKATASPCLGLWVGLVLAVSGVAGAQPAPRSYVLGPGDVLSVSVWGYPDMTIDASIGPDGTLTVPLVGSVHAAGLSVDQVVALLARAYGEYLVNPRVTVIIKQYRTIRIALLGQVMHPGVYELPPGARVLDGIAAAGGLTDAAATRAARLLQPGHAPIDVDLASALGGDRTANVMLSQGETLVVPEDLSDVVNVQGQVVRPGQFRLKGPMRVMDALALAGGLTDRASLPQATIVHASGEKQPLALDSLLVHQDMVDNVLLQPGDTIFVPEETDNKVYVLGDVRNPGVYTLQASANVTLLQALAMAGGPEQRGIGTAKTVYVVRRSVPPQEITAGPGAWATLPHGGSLLSAQLQDLMHDPTRDVAVQPGDVIVVPQTTLGGLWSVLSVLAGIAASIW